MRQGVLKLVSAIATLALAIAALDDVRSRPISRQ
jgi:hypothetical protein